MRLAPHRRRLLVASLVAVGLLLFLVAVFVLPRRAALACLLTFQDDVPSDLAGYETAPAHFRLLEDPARYGVHRAWLARPAGNGRHPILLFVHGVAEQGLRDGRILRAVEAFRKGGFLVVAPEVPGLVDPARPDDDLGRMLRLLSALEANRLEGGDAARLGVVGISVGGAFALHACARHRAGGGRGPLALCAIGAPEDVRRPAEDWFRLTRPAEEAPHDLDRERRDVAGFARNFVFRSALRNLVHDDAERSLIRAWLEADRNPTRQPEGLTTEAARAFVRLVLAEPPFGDAVRDRILEAAWDSLQLLSPHAWSADLRHLAGVTVFLLHGEGDPLVPVGELSRLHDVLAPHTLVVDLRSRMIGHTKVEDVGLGERLAHVLFMHDFFLMSGHR